MAARQFLGGLNVKFILIAVPLFVFAAKVMNSGAVTEKIFKFANSLVGRWRGGMGHVNVVASITPVLLIELLKISLKLCAVKSTLPPSALISPLFKIAF